MFHADGSNQYRSGSYRQLHNQTGQRQIVSARFNPYHKACTESFIGKLKNEMFQDSFLLDEADDRTEIVDYIDAYYYIHRQHSALAIRLPLSSRLDYESGLMKLARYQENERI